MLSEDRHIHCSCDVYKKYSGLSVKMEQIYVASSSKKLRNSPQIDNSGLADHLCHYYHCSWIA